MPSSLNESYETAGRLRQFRKALEFTQAEIAAELGLTPQAWGNYERGVTMPSLRSLRLMMAKFDMNADWLLLGRGPMKRPSRPHDGRLSIDYGRLSREFSRMEGSRDSSEPLHSELHNAMNTIFRAVTPQESEEQSELPDPLPES